MDAKGVFIMEISIASYSFHRLLGKGQQDIFQYIQDCKTLGCTRLEPWNAHFTMIHERDNVIKTEAYSSEASRLTEAEVEYLSLVKQAANQVELPFGCIAVDGAYIYDDSEVQRNKNRAKAYRWLSIAEKLGAQYVRIDAGGRETWEGDVFPIIVEGYRDIIARARVLGIEVLVENHWGISTEPENLIRLLEAVPDLGLLLDSFNWAYGKQAQGWLQCAKYAKATHIKTFAFTESGEELTQNIATFCKLLIENGFKGCWGVESVPIDGDEFTAARQTIALIKESVQ